MKNKWLFIGALSGFLSIALGAFAAHGLASILDEKALEWIDTGLKYQMFHTIALVGLGLFQIANQTQNPPACRAKAFTIIGGSWTLGILLFSGSLYLLAFGASKALVWLTPIGGTAFLVGWAALMFISFKGKKQ
ncbi:DUF423 domain-containing protein [Otariodibacter oris]|uniref:Uncharacterized membrane protein YgdD (TMEM256/DUF423 family) n=1 Tax=Otariodibacter oris TaxID=1032623 RepID=A0A420XI69_9PAST|nr:DUF423 domain-containing protein [Otariodibacter oris]QGM80775.1 hypothetical protein A6A10_04835 [Otariodibacter oris]RKR77057.1 uncharacterized membrane protein YgdD (TMEM256/DUF423 family) [Otariodibacter oris]